MKKENSGDTHWLDFSKGSDILSRTHFIRNVKICHCFAPGVVSVPAEQSVFKCNHIRMVTLTWTSGKDYTRSNAMENQASSNGSKTGSRNMNKRY